MLFVLYSMFRSEVLANDQPYRRKVQHVQHGTAVQYGWRRRDLWSEVDVDVDG